MPAWLGELSESSSERTRGLGGGSAPPAAQDRSDRATVGLAARRLHDRTDERADGLVLAVPELLPGGTGRGDGVVDERLEGRRVHRLEALGLGDRRGVAAIAGDELGQHLLGL